MKRIHLLYAAVLLVIVAVYYSREGFGPSTDINMGLDPVPTGKNREYITCGDQTRAEVGQCSVDSQNGDPTLMPF